MSREIIDLRRMSPEHESLAKRMLKLKPTDKLPDQFTKMYWAHKNVADRVQEPISNGMLVSIAILSGCDVSPPPPPSVFELWQAGKIKHNHFVGYMLDGKAREGYVSSVDMTFRRVTVRDKNDGQFRDLKAEDVNLWPEEKKEPVPV